MKTGMSGRVTAMMIALMRSAPRTVTRTASGMITASTSWGRYLA